MTAPLWGDSPQAESEPEPEPVPVPVVEPEVAAGPAPLHQRFAWVATALFALSVPPNVVLSIGCLSAFPQNRG